MISVGYDIGRFLIQIVLSYVTLLKDRVHCFSMQVVMNKCFLLNPKKNFPQIRLVVFVFEKNAKNAPVIQKNDVTVSKSRRLAYSNNQLKAVNR